jgi:hypothetical protein
MEGAEDLFYEKSAELLAILAVLLATTFTM